MASLSVIFKISMTTWLFHISENCKFNKHTKICRKLQLSNIIFLMLFFSCVTIIFNEQISHACIFQMNILKILGNVIIFLFIKEALKYASKPITQNLQHIECFTTYHITPDFYLINETISFCLFQKDLNLKRNECVFYC